jgi:pimeloyl-ACP methyl ester carboxylesterase
VFTALAVSPVSSDAQSTEPVVHTPPVTAPIVDAFRPPSHPFGPGNRGLEYDTEPGTEVRASADGQVVFAGEVAGSLHVTLRHADGIRTSYSFLDRIDAVVGQQVGQGDRIGVAGERFHFGARQGDAYFDPATLFGSQTQVEVELLPFEVPPGATPDQERTALTQLAMSRGGGGFGIDLPSLGDLAGWAVERAQLLHHYTGQLNPLVRGTDVTWQIASRLAFPPPCTDAPPPRRPAAPAADGDRVAVLVGGLGSSSESASIDDLRADELGYRPDDVVRFSYAGGRTPGSGAAFETLDTTPYSSVDTQGDLQASARRLADLVEAAVAERPGATIDLYGHSMGGVVTGLALQELARRGVDLDGVGLVATFGSPHQGADLATAATAANTTLAGDLGLEVTSQLLETGLDPDSEAIAQLGETSAVIEGLRNNGLPDGVEVLSVAASGDVVVAAPTTEVAGARNITVTLTGLGAHGDLVASDEATDEVARALAGQPQGCEHPWEVISEELTGHGISYAEDLGGFAVLQSGS